MNYLYDVDLTHLWALDLETDGLNPTEVFCAVVENLGTNEVLEFTPKEIQNGELRRFILERPEVYWVGHNFIAYDSWVLSNLLKVDIHVDKIIDTLVLSYLYNPYPDRPEGLPKKIGPHSLEAYGLRLKYPKQLHEDWTQYSEEMLLRCRKDTHLTSLVYHALAQRMRRLGFSEQSCQIEHRFANVIAEQTRNGFWFDKDRAKSLLSELRSRQSDLSKQIQVLFPSRLTPVKTYKRRTNKDGSTPALYERHIQEYDAIEHHEDGTYTTYRRTDFNIASPKQRIERLLELGWEPTEFTPGGSPRVDEDELKKFAEKSGKTELIAIADWLVLNARCGMIENWLSFVREDHCIHGRVFSCGASSRRCRHSEPNSANIPSDDNQAAYGKECRSLWGTRDKNNRRLVGYDAKGLESVGLCHYLANPEADTIILGSDFHQFNSKNLTEGLGFEVIRGGGGAKSLFYAFLYGAGDKKLGLIIKKPAKIGKEIRQILMSTVPGLAKLKAELEKEWNQNNGLLRTIDGGFVRCHSPSAALNYKIQSLGAILMKLTAVYLRDEIIKEQLDVLKVGDIHDEGQLDTTVGDADRVGALAVECIERAGRDLGLRVPVTGSYKIGSTWDETH